jgi:hypothetical protein
MAAAPDYESIFDLEEPIEAACKLILRRDYGVKGYTQWESDDDLPDERVDIQLRVGAHTGHRGPYATGLFVRDAWKGTLTFIIWTKRDPERKAVHGRTRARIRMAAEYFQGKFTAEELPYHVITSIALRDSEPSVSIEDDLDLSTVIYDVIISVREGAWPSTSAGSDLLTEDGQMLATEAGDAIATETEEESPVPSGPDEMTSELDEELTTEGNDTLTVEE